MALASKSLGRFAEIVEKGSKVSIAGIDLVPDAFDAARIEPGCNEGGLARTRGCDHANGGFVGARFIEHGKQAFPRHRLVQARARELGKRRTTFGWHSPSPSGCR